MMKQDKSNEQWDKDDVSPVEQFKDPPACPRQGHCNNNKIGRQGQLAKQVIGLLHSLVKPFGLTLFDPGHMEDGAM
jgi:hypothetical protein